MNTIPLTATQSFVLRLAAVHPERRIEAFPDNVKGGARAKVLAALLTRCLIRSEGNHLVLTGAGFSALGLGQPAPLAPDELDDLEATVADAEAGWLLDAEMSVAEAPVAARPARPRACSKQATLLALLARAEGASIAQLTEALGWQAHSVRGALVTVPRKWGYSLHCEKVDGVRKYRLQMAQTEAAAA